MPLHPIFRYIAAALFLVTATLVTHTHATVAATGRLAGRTTEATVPAIPPGLHATEATEDTNADANLLNDAVDAIGSLARDTATVGRIRAAARLVTELDAYAALRASGRLDRADSLRLAALRACAEVADARLAAHPEARARALYQLALVQAGLADTSCLATIDAAVRAARRAGGVGQGGEADEALVLYGLTRLYFLNRLVEGENPLRFTEILSLEKCALTLAAKRPASLDRAETFQLLAQLKSYTGFPDELGQASDSLGMADLAAPVAPYETDPASGQWTNALHYYRESAALYRRLLGSGHPGAVYPWMNHLFSLTGTADGAWITASADSAVAVMEAACPVGHPEVESVKAFRDRIAALCGQPLRHTSAYATGLSRYRIYYGRASRPYLSQLAMVAGNLQIVAANGPLPQAFIEMEEEYADAARQVYADEPATYLSEELSLARAYEIREPARFATRFAELAALALDPSAAPSWRRFTALRELVPLGFNNGRSAEAERLARASIREIDVLTGGRPLPATALAWLDLANLLQNTSHSADTVKRCYEQALHLFDQTGQPLIMPLYNYANYVHSIGEQANAIRLYRTILSTENAEAFPTDMAYIRTVLGSLLLQTRGELTDSVRQLFEEARPVFEADSPAVNNETVRGFIALSVYYGHIGQAGKAEAMLRRGWELAQGVCHPLDGARMELDATLFDLFMDQGRDHEAEALVEGELASLDETGMRETIAGLELLQRRYLIVNWRTPNDFPKVYATLMDRMDAVTAVYAHSGQAAHIRYRYFLPIACDYISETGRFIAWKDMAMATGGLSDKEKAQIDALGGTLEEMVNLVSPAIAILEDVERGFPDYAAPFDYRLDPAYASLIQSLWTWHENIRPDSARARHYIRLVAEIQKLRGQPLQADWTMAQYHNAHGDVAEAYAYAARCRQAPEAFTALQRLQICQLFGQAADRLGHENEAVRAAVEQAGHVRRYVRANFDFLSSGERAEFLTTYGNSGAAIATHLDRRPAELAAEAYDAALFDKGLLLHSWERLRRAILRSGDSLLAARLDTLDLLRKQQRQAAIAPLDSTATRKQLDLMQRMEGIEKALARQAAQFRPDTLRTASWREVQARLAPDEAAVEFTFADTALAALVVRPGMDRPRYVRLGSSRACYDLLHRSERLPADTRVRRLYTYGRSPLYDLVWRPLEAHLRGVRRVYYSPIAMLHRVAFAALPVGSDSCLVDRYDLCPLSTTAELLRPRREEAVRTAALFGGVHYSPGQGVTAATGTATEETEAATGKAGSRQRAALEEEFDYLSETLAETETIARSMNAAGIVPLTFKGEAATETAFYTLDGKSPDVIHLATHGFYINADDVEDNAFLMNHPGSRTQSMQRTGLAFAGANATWQGQRRNDREDGILTANELSLLDLSRTKLAVLSACETALGDYSTEGVWGLQRGFKEAGVGTLILSLWNVNDRATAQFMQAFYDQWLNGKPKRAAFSHAVDTLRRSHPNPFFWAAFVLLDAND